jgi:hypothetical protein
VLAGEQVTQVERVTVSEHFMVMEYVPVNPSERPTEPERRVPEFAA